MPRKNRTQGEDWLKHEIDYVKKHLDKLWEHDQESRERLQDIEVHLNLLTRLLTALCMEKLGMRLGVLKRMIKRIEKEAIRDSQIMHLENLYQLPHGAGGHASPTPPRGTKERWEDLS